MVLPIAKPLSSVRNLSTHSSGINSELYMGLKFRRISEKLFVMLLCL